MSKPNVYTANIDTLQSVPGVGEATIRRIQEMRESGRIITAKMYWKRIGLQETSSEG